MAETALSRISRVKAQAIADSVGHPLGPAAGPAGQPPRAVHQRPARHRHHLPDRPGLPHLDPGRPAVRHRRGHRRLRPQRGRVLRAGRGGAEDVRHAAPRAGGAGQHPADGGAGRLPAAAGHLPGPHRPDQRAAAGQGAEAGPVRLGAGAARHRRGRGGGRGDRARGARADRVDHRVRRHRRPRGDGPPPGHGDHPPRRDGQRRARHRHRARLEPAARSWGRARTTSSASATPRT